MKSIIEIFNLFNTKSKAHSLQDIIFMIDFLSPDAPFILSKDGSLMVAFEISGIEYEDLTPIEIADAEKELQVFAEIVKEDITISNYYIKKRGNSLKITCKDSAPEPVKFLTQKKEYYYNNLSQDTYQTTILCTIKLNRPLIKKTNPNFFAQKNQEFTLLYDQISENYKKLKDIYHIAKKSLEKIKIKELSPKEIFTHFFYIINGDKEVPPYRPDLSLNSQLSRSSCRYKKDHFQVDNTSRRIVSVIDEPPFTELMFFKPYFCFPGEFIIKNSFTTLDYEKHKRKFEANYKISKSLLFKKVLSHSYVEEYEENQLKIEKENRKPYFHSLQILISSKDPKELDKTTTKAITQICKTGAYAETETNYLPLASISFFPGQDHFNERKRYILSSNLANLFIKGKLSKGDNNPLEYFLDRNDHFYGFNPFESKDAPHMIITGSTGKGKSYLLIKLLLSFLCEDSQIIAIDKSLEYFFEVLQKIFPGDTSIMKINESQQDFCFNPFLPPSSSKIDEEQMSLCEGLLEIIMGKHIKPGQRFLIRESLTQFFEEYKTITDYNNTPVPPIDLLVTIVSDKFRDKEIENSIRNWMEGDRGKILNSGIDSFDSKKYTLFDLSGMENRKDILEVVTYLLLSKIEKTITNKKDLQVKKILAIDEAKYYFDKKELQPLIDKFLRQGRKYNLGVILNFQSINDALHTDESGELTGWSKGLFENIQSFILFSRQFKIDSALNALKLNAHQKELYEDLKPQQREFLLISKKGTCRALTPITCPYTNAIATSNPTEVGFRDTLYEKNNHNIIEAVKQFVQITKDCPDLESRLTKINHFFRSTT